MRRVYTKPMKAVAITIGQDGKRDVDEGFITEFEVEDGVLTWLDDKGDRLILADGEWSTLMIEGER